MTRLARKAAAVGAPHVRATASLLRTVATIMQTKATPEYRADSTPWRAVITAVMLV